MGGHGFGTLAKVRGMIYYKLSPYEQKAFAGAITKGVPNTLRRIKESFFTVGTPFVLAYIVYDQTEKEHARLNRKNPAEFENDE